MSLEDQYDAWVRSVTGTGRHSATKQDRDAAQNSVNAMQAQLDALAESQKRQKSAADALNAVQPAGAATADATVPPENAIRAVNAHGLSARTVTRWSTESPPPRSQRRAARSGLRRSSMAVRESGAAVLVAPPVAAWFCSLPAWLRGRTLGR